MIATEKPVPLFGRRPWVMGILNVTSDSFSDGGRWDSTDKAIAHGRELIADGADLVDVGGESTRPGAHRVDAAQEMDRVVPVVRALSEDGVLCSVDTTRAEVARAALLAGAGVVNDVSAGQGDPEMINVVADFGTPWILMHWRGPSEVMARLATYRDVVSQVRGELLQRVDAALAAGIDERSLILDPGLGFAKNSDHNWRLLHGLSHLVDLGLPVLVGASRKRFLGDLLAGPDGLRPSSARETATAVVSVLAAQHGAWGVRVHQPRPTLDAFAVIEAVDAVGRETLPLPTRAVPPQAIWPASWADVTGAVDGATVGRLIRPPQVCGDMQGAAEFTSREGQGGDG